jgi:hypothetical protein
LVYLFPALDLGAMAGERFFGPCARPFDRADQKTEVVGPAAVDEGREVHAGVLT